MNSEMAYALFSPTSQYSSFFFAGEGGGKHDTVPRLNKLYCIYVKTPLLFMHTSRDV